MNKPVITVTPAGKRRVNRCVNENRCVACCEPFDGTTVIRGCHERCHRATSRAVAAGHTTEEKRIAAGKWLPSKHIHSPVSVEIRKDI